MEPQEAVLRFFTGLVFFRGTSGEHDLRGALAFLDLAAERLRLQVGEPRGVAVPSLERGVPKKQHVDAVVAAAGECVVRKIGDPAPFHGLAHGAVPCSSCTMMRAVTTA